MYMEYICTVF